MHCWCCFFVVGSCIFFLFHFSPLLSIFLNYFRFIRWFVTTKNQLQTILDQVCTCDIDYADRRTCRVFIIDSDKKNVSRSEIFSNKSCTLSKILCFIWITTVTNKSISTMHANNIFSILIHTVAFDLLPLLFVVRKTKCCSTLK